MNKPTPLGEIVRIKKGRKAAKVFERPTKGLLPYLQIDEVRGTVPTKVAEDPKGVEVTPEDLCIVWDGANAGTIGYGVSGLIGSTVARMRLICPQEWETGFLGRLLEGKFREINDHAQARGATVPHVNKLMLEQILVPKLQPEEQSRIVMILDKADAIRRKREQILTLADDLLKSAFLEIFGDPLMNPKNWRVRPLKDYLLEIRYGTSIKCQNIGGEDYVPVLRIPNVVGGMVSWRELKYARLPWKELQRVRLKLGDILFVRTNGNPEYIGRCAVFESSREAAFASYLIRARLREDAKVTPLHVRTVVSFPSYRHRIIQEAKTTAGNYNINTRGLRSLPIIEPKKDLQVTYARLVSETRKIVTSGQQGLRHTEDLLASLSQRAFRGEL
ncbi:MAG: restriction endonuclease subunit S [Rhodospirillaceae bacterium]|nr:restriction endonuclease subunit S [Rhodospirillaceae bacterium]